MDIKKVYEDYAKQGNDAAQQLGWNNLETQDRYMRLMVEELVAKHIDLRGKTIHDAGCGYGDLLNYLPKVTGSDLFAQYMGTDLMPASVEEAKKRHPQYRFWSADLLKDVVPYADVTICMGALAFHRADNAMLLLERLWEKSREALAFNCWWDLTPAYVGYWENQKLQKRVTQWLKSKRAVMLSEYEKTERMFLVTKA